MDIFAERLKRNYDELKWLYMELYDNEDMYAELEKELGRFYGERSDSLKKMDLKREKDNGWYKQSDT